jgi:hypothetical protein
VYVFVACKRFKRSRKKKNYSLPTFCVRSTDANSDNDNEEEEQQEVKEQEQEAEEEQEQEVEEEELIMNYF